MRYHRPFIAALGGLAASLPSMPAWCDSATNLTPSVTVGRGYDDNLLFTPTGQQASAFWRVSPALEADYLSAPLTVAAFLTVDAERYTQHPELNGNAVRRDEAVDVTYTPAERLTLTGDLDYISTYTPAELTAGSSFGFGRTRARVYTAKPTLTYRLDPVLTGRMGLEYEEDELVGSVNSFARTPYLGMDYATSQRSTWSLDYADTDYGFSNRSVTSRVLTAGWAYDFGPETKMTLAAGPRNTDGETTAEVAATWRSSFEDGSIFLNYARSQTMVFGFALPVNTRTYQATFDYTPGAHFEFMLIPNVTQDESAGTSADVYRMDVNLSYKFDRSVIGICTYQYNRQRGLLGGIGDVEITDRVIFLGLVFRYTANFGGSFPEHQTSPFETLWPAPRH